MSNIQTDMISRVRDNEIAGLMTRLEALVIKHGLEKVDHAGLRYKSAGARLAATDLPESSACWYMRCVSGDRRHLVVSGKPDLVILGVIKFFEEKGWKE